MKFGLNLGVGGGSGLVANLAFIEYLMGNIFRDDSMEAYLYNSGNTRSVNDGEAFASNHIYLTGTQKVPYPVLHDLGSEEVTTNPDVGGSTLVLSNITPTVFTISHSGDGRQFVDVNPASNYTDDTTYKMTIQFTVVSGTVDFSEVYIPYSATFIDILEGDNTVIEYVGTSPTSYLERIFFECTVATEIDLEVSVKEITLPSASYFTIFSSDTSTITQLSAIGDSGSTLPISTHYNQEDSHQFNFNSTAPLEAIDVIAIEADPNLAFRMFFDGEILPSGFSRANDMVDCNFFGGNEGLATAEKVYDLSDQTFTTYVSIENYDSTCKTELANQSTGASNLKLIQDGSGRTTGIATANTTQWKTDGRTAVTNWTITAPFTIAEVIDGDVYVFTSTGNRYKNLILDGTYTVPTGIWTLDEFGFDGVTPVTIRGATGVIDEVVVP